MSNLISLVDKVLAKLTSRQTRLWIAFFSGYMNASLKINDEDYEQLVKQIYVIKSENP
jgi:hypothetical protein